MMKTRSVFLMCLAALLLLPSFVLAQGGTKRKAAAAPKNVSSEPSPAVQDAVIAAHRKALLSKIQTPPLSPFHPQLPKRIELPNGMIIFLQEDHELPLIDGSITIRGGSRVEPAAKVGLVGVFGQVWRTGGTRTRTGDQLDDYLEARAAKVETGGGLDSTTVGWSSLKNDFNDVFDVVLELLREPEFRSEKVLLAKQQIATGISRRNDDPAGVARREAVKLAYGADSPFARVVEYATLDAVTRQDLLDWHQRFVQPNNMILGVTGDFDPAAMEANLREAFSPLPKGLAAEKNPPTAIHAAKPGIYFVNKEDVNQSNIRMVDLGIRKDNPDFYAVEVMNEIMGGGFSSRLIQSIRTKLGLAYSVGGGIGSSYDHPGLAALGMGTKSETTVKSIAALDTELNKMQSDPVTLAELKRAKDAILNSFVFEFDSKDKVLDERMTYEFYGYPADFLERYRAGVEKVTTADVERVAKKYLHKDQMKVLVVGNQAEFDKPLSALGPVTPIDITIPGAPSEVGTAVTPAK
jgi:zinc protease